MISVHFQSLSAFTRLAVGMGHICSLKRRPTTSFYSNRELTNSIGANLFPFLIQETELWWLEDDS